MTLSLWARRITGTTRPSSSATAIPRLTSSWSISLVVLGAGAWFIWHNRHPPPVAASATSPREVELAAREMATVSRADLRRVVRLSGTTRADEQVLVRSQLAATVAEVLVREGDRVNAGQVLARLDTRDLQATLDQRVANLASTEAALAYAARDLSNKRQLAGRGAGSRMAAEQAESSFQQARAAFDANQAFIAMARKALADATIRSPIDGTIGQRSIDLGGTVAVGGELFRILDLTTLEVDAAVPAGQIGLVQVGQSVTLQAGLGGAELSGTVARINPATEAGSQAVIVHVRLPNPGHALRAGVFVTGAVVVAEAKHALAVPEEAIRTADGEPPTVLRITGGTLQRQPVELGLVSDTQGLAEVRGGLAEGDRVVRALLPGLAPGQAVKVAGEPGAGS